jgi:uncharacterized phage protein (TIGR02220 family)
MNLLISEPPLQVLPSLAKSIGLNEAIFLQQLHYWLLKSTHIIDGNKWVYNSVTQWQEQFPFWCQRTIKNIIYSLEKSGILVSGNFNKKKSDKTKWYRIDYSRMPTMGQDLPVHEANFAQPLPETTPETTTTLTDGQKAPSGNANINNQAKEVLEFLNSQREAKGEGFRFVDTNLNFIKDRLKSGVSVEDCKKVIINQKKLWSGTPSMTYFRPATLFNKTKFEQYFGQIDRTQPLNPEEDKGFEVYKKIFLKIFEREKSLNIRQVIDLFENSWRERGGKKVIAAIDKMKDRVIVNPFEEFRKLMLNGE